MMTATQMEITILKQDLTWYEIVLDGQQEFLKTVKTQITRDTMLVKISTSKGIIAKQLRRLDAVRADVAIYKIK